MGPPVQQQPGQHDFLRQFLARLAHRGPGGPVAGDTVGGGGFAPPFNGAQTMGAGPPPPPMQHGFGGPQLQDDVNPDIRPDNVGAIAAGRPRFGVPPGVDAPPFHIPDRQPPQPAHMGGGGPQVEDDVARLLMLLGRR